MTENKNKIDKTTDPILDWFFKVWDERRCRDETLLADLDALGAMIEEKEDKPHFQRDR